MAEILLKRHIFIGVWNVQHPQAGQNIQQALITNVLFFLSFLNKEFYQPLQFFLKPN